MKYIVYLTTNLKSQINGLNRIYVGVHQTNDPSIFDGYLGCGCYANQPSTYMYPKTPFQYAVKKYGPSAFMRTVLFIYDDKQEAYNKESEIVNLDFIQQSHTYNVSLGGTVATNYQPLYQFDLNGTLVKTWEYSIEAYEFYQTPRKKFDYAVNDKHPLFDSLWSRSDTIDISEYSTKPWGEPKVTHLYDINGKWINEFISRKDCADHIGSTEQAVVKAIKQQSLIVKQYYVSDYLVDELKPKARRQYAQARIYVYNEESQLLGSGIGKEIMPIIQEYSWNTIRDAFRYKDGWYKTFYLSLQEINRVPERILGSRIKIDVYTKYGDFIETLNTVKEVRQKYGVPSSKIKNIEQGNRYFKDWIFKYHTSK